MQLTIHSVKRSIYQNRSKVWIAFSPPDKSVENVMGQLRHREQRNEINLPTRPIPICPEQPMLLVPNPAIPEQFLNIRKRPKSRKKDDPVLRKRTINLPGRFASRLRIKPDQRKIRHAVDDHVRTVNA